jgi:hypothetical protein
MALYKWQGVSPKGATLKGEMEAPSREAVMIRLRTQRIALGGLNGAACDLGTSREELILSLDPKSGIGDVTWDRATAAKAIQSGTSRAIDDAVDRGTLPSWAGRALRFVVERAPIQWLLDKLPI